MTGRQPRSMAVRHYRALYGTPPPLTWAQVARRVLLLALTGLLIAKLIGALT